MLTVGDEKQLLTAMESSKQPDYFQFSVYPTVIMMVGKADFLALNTHHKSPSRTREATCNLEKVNHLI